MTEDIESKPRRASDEALASSSPDINHGFMQLIRQLFRDPSKFKVFCGAILGGLFMLFVVGLPAINGTTILIDKMSERDSAERAYQLDMFKLQTDVEMRKLEMTSLGEGAVKTLNEISLKLDAQQVAIHQQGERIERLSQEVATIRGGQAADRRQISAIAARQREIGRAALP